jgi:hypothetical protein
MQQMFPGFGELSAQPLKHNFEAYLKAQNLSKSEIAKIIHKLETDENNKYDEVTYYTVAFALETIKSANKPSNRDIRKLECYYLYQQLAKTKMKRSEIVWTIANKMGVNKDCIQVYLREIFSS